MDMTKQQCIDAAEAAEREARDLGDRYSGVRPGWVSTDLGMIWARVQRYRAMAEDGRE